jgi:hypothetical protein
MAYADALARELGEPYVLGLNDLACGVAEYLAGRWRAALERLERAETILRDRCTGVAWDLDTCHLYRLRTRYLLGDVAHMCDRVPRLVDEAQERGDRLGTTLLRARIVNMALLVADAPDAAREACREGIASWSQRGFHQEHYFEWAGQTEIDLYEGLGAAAVERVNGRWRALQGSLITRVQVVRVQAVDLRGRAAAALAAADPATRARLLPGVERDARTLDAEGIGLASAFAHRLRASAAVVGGDVEAALAELASAERAFGDLDMVLHATAARRRRGQLTGGDAGRADVAAADAWAASQTIRNPDRFFGMFGA